MGDSFEIGMQSIADGFQAMTAAMAQPAAAASSTTDLSMVASVDSRFNAMMQRHDEQLAQMQVQNQQLAVLIATLQRGNSN
ncbi:hypothetical protein PI124_g12944 [Phytophthora idaei]|nr:hypothetical protein PI125_g12481 [Phytophthora idaei]KAG3150421.1 hypothetical protein PI126_g11515 [Phytophthora idaei]KAG3242197.1 hypothetical protein PI124_g12944 [Phytophthora idaei]